jgi:hypothetical protein
MCDWMIGDVHECHSLPCISFAEERAPTHVSLARIDPIVSPHSVRGNKFPAPSSIRLISASVAAHPRPAGVAFCAAPAPLSDVARPNGRHPQGFSDRTMTDSFSTPRCDLMLSIMALLRHTFRFPSIERFVTSPTTSLGQQRVV